MVSSPQWFINISVNSGQTMQSQRRRSSVLDYEQSLMFGQYREKLSNFAVTQSQKSNQLREHRKKNIKNKTLKSGFAGNLTQNMFRVLEWGGDWILLAVLAIIVALLSFLMDVIIHLCFERS